MKFLIWSWEHHAWWGPDRCGYTTDPAQAGRYGFDDAARIVIGHVPAGEEVAIYEAEAERNGWCVGEFTLATGTSR